MRKRDVIDHWRAVAETLTAAHGTARLSERELDELFAVQSDIRSDLDRRDDVPRPDDPDIVFVVDALAALAFAYPADPSHPWSRAGVLARVARHLEAADDYLRAAALFDDEFAAGHGLTGDEDDWARGARAHAARCLLSAIAAADRPEIEREIQASLERLARHAAA